MFGIVFSTWCYRLLDHFHDNHPLLSSPRCCFRCVFRASQLPLVPTSLFFASFLSLRQPPRNRQDQHCQQHPAAPRRALRLRRRRRPCRRRCGRQETPGFGAAARGQGHAQHRIQRGQQTTKAEATDGEVGMQNIWKWSFRKPRWWYGFGDDGFTCVLYFVCFLGGTPNAFGNLDFEWWTLHGRSTSVTCIYVSIVWNHSFIMFVDVYDPFFIMSQVARSIWPKGLSMDPLQSIFKHASLRCGNE